MMPLDLPPKIIVPPAIVTPGEHQLERRMERAGLPADVRVAVLRELRRHGLDVLPLLGMPFHPGFRGGPVGAELVYISSTTDTVNRVTYPFANQSFGDEHPERYTIVAVTGRINVAANINSGTINGVAAHRAVHVSAGQPQAIFILHNPTGTSGEVSITFSTTMTSCRISVYRAIRLSGELPYATGSDTSAGDDDTVSLSVPAGGICIAIARANGDIGMTFSGVELSGDSLERAMEGFYSHAAGHGQFNSAQNPLAATVHYSPATASAGLAAASWGPRVSFVALLLHMDGADGSTVFVDSAQGHAVTAVNNAQIDTAQSKFGGASALFDGAGDYLRLDGSNDFAFGNGDFTIEFWVRLAATGATYNLYDSRPASTTGAYPTIFVGSGDSIRYHTAGADRISGPALAANTWYHVAVARFGTSTKMFLDGAQVGATYSDSNIYLNGADRPIIGANGNSLGAFSLNGWIDELRVSKGVARYTSNFTPPTEPFLP